MPVVNYWGHLPYLRLPEETIPFGPGLLWRLPFDVWSQLTGGAFVDHRPAYNATAPVFFYLETEVDWPILVPGVLGNWQAIELKKPSYGEDEFFEDIGFSFLTRFVDSFGWIAQAALSLAAPATAVGSVRHSMVLFTPDEGHIQVGSQEAMIARMQGNADHELLLLSSSSADPLRPETVAFASELWDVVQACGAHPELGSALEALMSCSEPSLTDTDQMVLATMAIESLLLPEVRSGLQRTFTQRMSSLLASTQDVDLVRRAGEDLYAARSTVLHGEATPDQSELIRLARSGAAQQLLASCILALAPSLISDESDIEQVRQSETPPNDAIATKSLMLDRPANVRAQNRLGHEQATSSPFVITSSVDMAAEEGRVVSWSPLVGLGCEYPTALHPGQFMLEPLTINELVAMEERDITRDFIGRLRVDESLGTLDVPPHTCIAIFDDPGYSMLDLERRRELAVLTLRLAGFTSFVDPSLLGWYIFEGRQRIRIPTIFRQTIIHAMVHQPEMAVTSEDEETLIEMSELVSTYDQLRRHDEVDRLISEYLRGHPSKFLPDRTSASLMFAVLEGTLGRFRPKDEPTQLEDLVYAAEVLDEDAEWFVSSGRAYRNSVAHGVWDPARFDGYLELLVSLCGQVLISLLEFLVDTDPTIDHPTGSFLEELEARI